MTRRLTLALSAISLFSSASWGVTLDQIRARGSIVVGVDATFPPLEFVENGQKTGFDVELVELLAKKLNIPRVEWVDIDFKGLIPGLQAGRFDLVASGVYITDERRKVVHFSDSYLPGGMVVIVRQGDPAVTPPDRIRGAKVAVQTGTKSVRFLTENYPTAELVEVEKNAEMFAQVESGRADAVVTAGPAARYYIRQRPGLKILEPPLTSEHYGLVFRKEDEELLASVNSVLREIRNDGSYEALVRRWFTDGEKTVSRKIDFSPALDGFPALLRGAAHTILITFSALLLGTLLGLVTGLARLRPLHQVSYGLATFYVNVIRGTPLLVQLFLLFFGLPQFGILLPAFLCASLGLGIYSGAYVSEIVRGAIQSIDRGQLEAALSLGLAERDAMRSVIIPQALPRMLPPFGNELVAVIKNSALASLLTLNELMREGQRLISVTYRSFEVYLCVGALYFILIWTATYVLGKVEARLRTKVR